MGTTGNHYMLCLIDNPSKAAGLRRNVGVHRFGSAQASGMGQGVRVYTLDSGVRASHQEFLPWGGGPSRASYGCGLRARDYELLTPDSCGLSPHTDRGATSAH